jgi:hypothetical protein
LEKEYRFHPVRKWRAVFAHLESKTLIEIEGGIYVNGRHNRAGGFAADLENRARSPAIGCPQSDAGTRRQIPRSRAGRLAGGPYGAE